MESIQINTLTGVRGRRYITFWKVQSDTLNQHQYVGVIEATARRIIPP